MRERLHFSAICLGLGPALCHPMRTLIVASLLLCVAGCGTDPEALPADRWQDVEEVSLTSFTHGLAPGSGRCDTARSRYNLREHVLVESECAMETRTLARPQDSADLRAALAGIEVVQQPCDGFDGVDASVAFRHANTELQTGYAIGYSSCSRGGTAADLRPTITSSSWGPVQTVLNRIRAAR